MSMPCKEDAYLADSIDSYAKMALKVMYPRVDTVTLGPGLATAMEVLSSLCFSGRLTGG